MTRRIHVVAAVIRKDDQILIAKRPQHLHQGGLWEFPGGKVDSGESVESALVRELQEELDITATCYESLMQVHHDYPDKQILLDVWEVTDFTGSPTGLEGQEIVWAPVSNLSEFAFPEANVPIIEKVLAPSVD